MKLLSVGFRLYITSSLHVAFAVSAFFYVSCLEFQIIPSFYIVAFVFFSSVLGYNFIKYLSLFITSPFPFFLNFKGIVITTLIALAGTMFCFFWLNKISIVILAFFGAISFFYAVPLGNKKNIRSFAGVKIFIVALVWAGVTVILPFLQHNQSFTTNFWLVILQRFFWVVVLTIPFEMRDLKKDPIYLETLPQRIGIQKTKVLGFVLLVLIIVLEGFKDEIYFPVFYATIFMIFVTGVVLLVSKKVQKPYFASFWVEAIPIVLLGIVFLLKTILP